jgi:GMP synthase (glutamine-hydrolysing)
MPPPIVLAVTGDPVPEVLSARGGFDRIFAEALGDHPAGYLTIDVRALPLDGPSPTAIILSGSSSHVHDREPWMIRTEAALRSHIARGVPVLGVCFGHQLLAQALGGEVRPNPWGREISTVAIDRLGDDPLLEGLSPRFSANACHSDTVVRLPAGATVLGRNAADPHQIVRFAPRAWGVQFHPEFDGAIMRGFLRARREAMLAEGLDADALEARASDTPEARTLLTRFLRMT